jgi:hypothetical protein
MVRLPMVNSRSLMMCVVLLVILIAALQPITDPDFWWHLKTGQYITETHSIPYTDVFSNSRFGSEWVTHEWLSEVFIYSIYRTLGFIGLIVIFGVIISASFWFVYLRFKSHVQHPIVAGFALLLGAAATTAVWGVRPQTLTLFLASITLFILGRYYRNESKYTIWWLVPLTILWVNLHAGFALGLTLILLTIVGLVVDAILLSDNSRTELREKLVPLVGVFLLSCAAVCVNPNGARMYSYPFETLRSQAMMRFIEEWRSPDFHQPHFQALALLLIGTFCALALSNKRIRPGELLLLAVTAFATLRSGRNVAFFSLAATPLFAEHLWNWLMTYRWATRLFTPQTIEPARVSPAKVALNATLIVLALIITMLGVRRAMVLQPIAEAREFPGAAVNFMLAERPPQPIYNEYTWGGYFIWRLYPDYRVYIDGRADVYGDQLVEESLKVHDANPGWRELLNKYGTRTVLVKPDSGLATSLRDETGWQKVFEDRQAIIFVRQ